MTEPKHSLVAMHTPSHHSCSDVLNFLSLYLLRIHLTKLAWGVLCMETL